MKPSPFQVPALLKISMDGPYAVFYWRWQGWETTKVCIETVTVCLN